ncbi:protein CLEC16A-like isoform X3 [Lineus longissimus]|uniref:protein CLEC16A-like isoform X3 n=1 Tax=Lineus longissimus TaxID=88925 RepID=UPI00315DCF76
MLDPSDANTHLFEEMFSKPKNWLSGGLWRPKNPHSLEHLKFLYNVLCKNQTITDANRSQLVETLRSISEILIWGDQNDSSVFDFFLEKNMLSFFLSYMRQKSGRYICVQLLQTLNILFENISNETSVYYLLSNNHINSIIVHKFDFSDEEVMAYYISFLKTLSLKLNKHTIHFFYNEHTNDFALYTEAIKFFNHSESMVRIAVRTITLNVYKGYSKGLSDTDPMYKYHQEHDDDDDDNYVDDNSMLRYIRDKTAAPYFSNLVWFIGNHIIELDICVRNDADHQSRNRLADLVAEHLDHLHYLNDILCLSIDCLNDVLTDHLLHRLLIPLYVYSLTNRRKSRSAAVSWKSKRGKKNGRPHVSSVVSLFLLSQVFLIMHHAPLVRQLANIIFNGDLTVSMQDPAESTSTAPNSASKVCGFVAPEEPLAQSLDYNRGKGKPMRRPNYRNSDEVTESRLGNSTFYTSDDTHLDDSSSPSTDEASDGGPDGDPDLASPNQNSTDEEKLLTAGASAAAPPLTAEQRQADFTLTNRPYLEAVYNALECQDNDYETLHGLCLLYAMGHNTGINQELLDSVLMPTDKSETKDHYNVYLIEKLIKIITLSCQKGSRVRLATLEMSILLLKQLVYRKGKNFLQDRHLACIEGAKEESVLLLRVFYKSEEIFLDMFEDEFREMKSRPLNVEYLTMDASILLPPTGTPLTGIEFTKRLPCGEVERARRAIRVFFILRDLSFTLRGEVDNDLPLTKLSECVHVGDVLDLNNSDLIACTIVSKDRKERRFLVIDVLQLILVEPDIKRLGWGVVRFVGFLQDVEVSGDKEDSRTLHVTIHKPATSSHARPVPLLAARFIFDDHIRCMAAKQRLSKGRLKARQKKMHMIARLLELPTHVADSMYQNFPGQYGPGAAMPSIPGKTEGKATSKGRCQPVMFSRPEIEPFSASDLPLNKSSQQRPVTRPLPINLQSKPQTPVPPDSPEIEEAQDATSPSAFAFQSLNNNHSESTESRGSHSRQSSAGGSMIQEIPLEDLSKRQRADGVDQTTLSGRRGSIPVPETSKRRVSLPGGPTENVRKRSSSYSPRRPHHTASPRSSSPRQSSHQVSSFSSSPSGKMHPKENSEKRAGQGALQKRDRSHSSPVSSTPAAVKQKRRGSEPKTTSSAKVSATTSPKTLTPARAPALSLVAPPRSEDNLRTTSSGPQLLPPADISNLPKDQQSEFSLTKPKFTFEAHAVPSAVVSAVSAKQGEQSAKKVGPGATDQLAKLAQMVQDHYSLSDDPSHVEMSAVSRENEVPDGECQDP